MNIEEKHGLIRNIYLELRDLGLGFYLLAVSSWEDTYPLKP